jgi:PKD repeat protein
LTVVAVDGEAVNVGQQIVLGSGALLTVDSTGGYSYDPNGQFEDLGVGETAPYPDSFVYTISDGNGGVNSASVSVGIAGVNDAPAAVQDSATVDESGADIAVLVNDSDPEGDPLTVTDVTDPANGTAAIDGDMVRYDPDPGFCLQDGFTYTVSDSNGGFDSATVSVQVTCANIPPVATFAYSCNDLTCTFDASGSDDPDGSIDSYNWDFGDSTDSGEIIDHTYDAAGIYSVVLTVTDDGGATDADIQDVTVSEPPDTMHIGDLDGDRTTNKNKWTARVTLEVHDSAHNPVSNATVSGTWSEGAIGTSACTTDASGQCMVSQAGILKRVPSVAFSVDDITQETLLYSPAENHDEGGDSDGTTVTVYLEVLTNQPPVASFIYSCVDLACDFDASASTDPDGSVAVYEWNFGDGNTDAVSGVVAYHAYASDGSYTVALTVTDNEGASDTDTQTVTVGESSNTIFVFAIDMSGKVGGLNRSATATVTIHDTDGNQVEGAMVYGTWSGDYSATVSGVTGPDGSVTFNSSKVRQANATFIFTVDSVVKSGYSYDSGLNAETIDTIVVP